MGWIWRRAIVCPALEQKDLNRMRKEAKLLRTGWSIQAQQTCAPEVGTAYGMEEGAQRRMPAAQPAEEEGAGTAQGRGTRRWEPGSRGRP